MIYKLVNNNGTSIISDLVTSLEWSGDIKNVARTVNLTYLFPVTDKNIPKIDVMCGNMLIIEDKGEVFFKGYVFRKNKADNNNEMSIVAYDGLIYLAKNKDTYNFKRMSTKKIVSKICADYGIGVGNVVDIGNITNLYLDKTLAETIIDAYAIADSNNKYTLRLDSKDKLNISKRGAYTCNTKVTGDTNLTSSDYEESIENLIDRVKVIDEEGKVLKVYSNDADIKSYGLVQTTFSVSEASDIGSGKAELHGIERVANLNVIGNIEYIAGNKILVEAKHTGLVGVFLIEGDTHSWKDGVYSTQLKLYFEEMSG